MEIAAIPFNETNENDLCIVTKTQAAETKQPQSLYCGSDWCVGTIT